MAQQQYQVPQGPGRPFSPLSSASPNAPQGFAFPPTKRQRVSPDPRPQPTSPYVQSPHTGSLTNTAPHFSNISVPPNIYNTPYGNGHTTPTISLPNKAVNYSPYQNSHPTPSQSQNHAQGQIANGNNPSNNFHTNNQFQNQNIPIQGAGMMGPPSKPADRDIMNDDQMDVLANAGVDLRAEENFAMSFHSGAFNSQPNFSTPGPNTIGHAFNQFTPGDSTSFYGSGPANQAGQPTVNATQDELQKKAAEMAWAEASLGLAHSRQHELKRPHVNIGLVWNKMERLARENGLILNTDEGKMPQLKLPAEFPVEVRVQSGVGPQGGITVTSGNFLPHSTALADQLALISLATNVRIRKLLEDAVALARGRRSGSHGKVPLEWADVSAPSHIPSGTMPAEMPGGGWESAVSPRTNPLKRSFATSNRLPTPISDGAITPTAVPTYGNQIVNALRVMVDSDRDFEEARLLKRQTRLAGDVALKVASLTPGTPGPSAAPEPPTKALTKKEREKQDKGKQSVADSHAQANATTNKFLFGTKSKSKYAWMNGGTGAAGSTSTPGKLHTQGLSGTPGNSVGGSADKQMLTGEGSKKWGMHREDKKDQAKLIEMRDLQAALESDGKEIKVLQEIYAWLETPRNRKA